MLDRLFAALVNGPGMNCRPHASRQRVDLTHLLRLNDIKPEEVLRRLLGADRSTKVVARVKPPKKSIEPQTQSTTPDATSGEEPPASPEQRAWDEQSALVNKLRVVADDARTYENDTGVHVLNLGFPLLSLPPGSFNSGGGGSRSGTKRILAPIAFVPITLSLKRGTSPTVELACRGEGVDLVMPNTALLAWIEQQTGRLQTNDLFADDEGEDPWREICDLVAHVAKAMNLDPPAEFKPAPSAPVEPAPVEPAPPEPAAKPLGSVPGEDEAAASSQKSEPRASCLPIPESLQLVAAPRPDADSNSPAILPSAVVGLFPMANQGLLRDTQAMLAQTADPSGPPLTGPVESFLSGDVDFDQPATPQITTTADAGPSIDPQHRVTRLFVTERLAAAADPCQSRAVALARAARGLVVHGPPGTGKSQTITNIIADHLSRGQRVLLVCDKRTALDVVRDRLEHMGLGQLCGIVHDPQRDQRELYMSIRQQLEELPQATTNPQAEAQLTKVDAELQKLHEELTQHHHALMSPRGSEASFHEMMGRWLAIRSDPRVQLSNVQQITPADLDARESQLLDLLRRAESVNYARDPWAKCAGVPLNDFLSRPMDAVRTAIDRIVAAATAVDATIDPAIPPLSSKTPLAAQGKARAELADRLQSLVAQISPTALSRWCGQDIAAIRAAQQKLKSIDSFIQTFRSGALDAGLRTTLDVSPPRAAMIPQQLRDLDAYLEVAGKWYAFLSFGAKSHATKVLRDFGQPLTVTEAERVRKFLNGVRARLTIHQVRSELGGAGESPASLPPDDVLDRFVSQHTELFELLLKMREDPALDGLAPLAAKALPDRAAADAFIEGLRKSPPRADALAAMEDAMTAGVFFDPAWLAAFDRKLRDGQPAAATANALAGQLGTLEGVLRVRQARIDLPPAIGKSVDELISQGVDPESAAAALRKAILAAEITRRLRDDPKLLALDGHRIESNFKQYRELETQKKQLVRDAVRHRWVSKQKDRLLAARGSRLNSLGADLGRRLLTRGQRAMRLRQVIAVGQRIDGGDPLLDVCPVWMASPETVAQVFPREPVFDVVIFDEASQCRLEEALPVLTRGQRVVIAGDPKQLPPTRFFETAFTQSEQEEPETEQELFEAQQGEVEDLLGGALNLAIEQCYLDVHYRSRNSDLIEFSNANFYNNRLQAIPGHPRNRSPYSPLTLYRVDGTYSARRNEAEADRVVQIVRELLKRAQPPSIGIACFNLQQRDLIVEKLDDMAGEDSEFGKKLAEARTRKGSGAFEGLFVKNLENVQGDERDHIIISTTYGPDSRGKFYRRFGPLGRAGGGRRLNVLVTRARHEVHLVTSIPPDAYRNLPPVPEGQTASGAWLLFAYLKYAEDLAAAYTAPDESQEDTDAKPQVAAPQVRPTRAPSLFAEKLADDLAVNHRVGSVVHWGNDGFCVDLALNHPARPQDVTVGVLTDSCRYPAAADDPVEWDIFRTGILADQGWQLRRVWTPHFFRDPKGNEDAILKDAAAFVANEKPVDAIPATPDA
jgi:hypothetical protein